MTTVNAPVASTPSPALVHESMDERQHVRVRIRARVELSGAQETLSGELRDLSVGGMLVRCKQPLVTGSLFDAQIHMHLSAAQLRIEAQVKVVSRRDDDYGLEFTRIGDEQRDILRYIISAHLSGEIANINGLLHVMQRENHIKRRKTQASTTRNLRERIRAILGSLLFIGAGLLICALLAYKLYLHFFHIPASQAQISANAYVVGMPDNGYVTFLAREAQGRVTAGQPLASVSTQLASNIHTPADLQALRGLSEADARLLLGRTLIETVIASPCDCELYFPGRTQDGYAYKGDELVHLLPADEDLFVTARFPFERLKDINRISHVRLQPFGSRDSLSGTVIGSDVDALTQQLVLRIRPVTALPRDSYRNPLAVDIYLGLPW